MGMDPASLVCLVVSKPTWHGALMGDLSKRLSRAEFACKCGCGFDTVDEELRINLDECADHFLGEDAEATRVIIHVNSGSRCANHDRAIKIRNAIRRGVTYNPWKGTSQHVLARGSDFWMEWKYEKRGADSKRVRKKIPDDDIADYLELVYVAKHGIGRYTGRTHYDTRTSGPARWDKRP